MIKLSVSIFGQTAVYRIYTVSREPIRFIYQNFNIQCLVFSNYNLLHVPGINIPKEAAEWFIIHSSL